MALSARLLDLSAADPVGLHLSVGQPTQMMTRLPDETVVRDWRAALGRSELEPGQQSRLVEDEPVCLYFRALDFEALDPLAKVFLVRSAELRGQEVRLVCEMREYTGATGEEPPLLRPLVVVELGRLAPGEYTATAEVVTLGYQTPGKPEEAVARPIQPPPALQTSFRVSSMAEDVIAGLGASSRDRTLRFSFTRTKEMQAELSGRVAVFAGRHRLGADQAGVEAALALLRQLKQVDEEWVPEVEVVIGDPDGGYPELAAPIRAEAEKLGFGILVEGAG